jgi:hypothetical protein
VSISFTQYLLPSGRQCRVSSDRPPEIEAIAKELHKSGVYFDIEILSTGLVSMTAEREDDDGETVLLACEITVNGPEILLAVDRMIRTAAAAVLSSQEEHSW